jgi:hypothetical protein
MTDARDVDLAGPTSNAAITPPRAGRFVFLLPLKAIIPFESLRRLTEEEENA